VETNNKHLIQIDVETVFDKPTQVLTLTQFRSKYHWLFPKKGHWTDEEFVKVLQKIRNEFVSNDIKPFYTILTVIA
jgi:hypothetical protein